MAEYLIQTETLDDIANAINAKTGGSSAMTPAEMVTAIGSIETGGGGEKVFTKLGEYTISNPVSAITIMLTEQMKKCETLYVSLSSVELSAADWVYPVFDNASIQSGGMGYTEKGTSFTGVIAFAPVNAASGFDNKMVFGDLLKTQRQQRILNPQSVVFRLYTSGVTFNSGSIDIWGYI